MYDEMSVVGKLHNEVNVAPVDPRSSGIGPKSEYAHCYDVYNKKSVIFSE